MVLNKIKGILILLLLGFVASAQDPASLMVKLEGKIFSKSDSTLLKGKLMFEKLPYYDDLGIAVSQSDGMLETYLLKGHKYILKATAEGFESTEMEYLVNDGDAENGIYMDYYLTEKSDRRLISLDNLIFDTGRAAIRPSSYSELDGLAEWLLSKPRLIIQLEGHTDPQGNASANMKLSQERVDAVKDYLVRKGVNKNQVLTRAFGGTMPITTNKDELSKNRRVEVRVIQE